MHTTNRDNSDNLTTNMTRKRTRQTLILITNRTIKIQGRRPCRYFHNQHDEEEDKADILTTNRESERKRTMRIFSQPTRR